MSHLAVGADAPDFSLASGPGAGRITLSQYRGETVVLLFVPLAFSGTCTAEFCEIRDNWGRWTEVGARVLGLSVDSPFVTRRWAEELQVPFPVLSDFNKEAAAAYGVLYEEWFGLKGVAKRSAFVVGPDGVVTYAWVSEDADLVPPFDDVLAAVRASG